LHQFLWSTPTSDNIVLEILFSLVSASGVELTVFEFFEIVTTGPLLFRVFAKQGETVIAVPEKPVELDQTVCYGESEEDRVHLGIRRQLLAN
jgi:hypothetical protein